MSKRSIIASAILAAVIASPAAIANNQHTVSIGYAQSKIEDFNKDLKGVNVQYRYEFEQSPLSVLGSFTYMSVDDNDNEEFENYSSKFDVDVKYYSFLVGPAYRFNEYVSIYGNIGFAHAKADTKEDFVHYGIQEYDSDNATSNSFAYGAGVIINPIENISISAGYEGTRMKFYDDSISVNGFNITLGYRF